MVSQYDSMAHVRGTLFIKHDEAQLLLTIYEQQLSATALGKFLSDCGIAPKRLYYILCKWCDRGWLACGVSMYSGWLTPLGNEMARELLAREEKPA